MNVLIEALAARYGGTAAATVQLARHLTANAKVMSVTVVTRPGAIVEIGLHGEPGVRCIAVPARSNAELLQRVAWEGVRLPRLIRRELVDVTISMSGILPRSLDCRLVCLMGNPVMYESASATNALRRRAARRTARDAAYIAAPSHHMAEMVSSSIGKPCAVLPWGIDHTAFSPGAAPGGEILCVADFKAYKRQDLVLEIWRRLPPPRPKLRFVGNPDVERNSNARLLAQMRGLPEAESVVVDHTVPHELMPDIYRRARVFVLPSEHESFCMPLAESMACGVPGVVRGLRSLRETGGDGATYLDSDNPADWATVVERMLNDDLAHAHARGLALKQAARFSWEEAATELARHL